jgi:hypothetical protein
MSCPLFPRYLPGVVVCLPRFDRAACLRCCELNRLNYIPFQSASASKADAAR